MSDTQKHFCIGRNGEQVEITEEQSRVYNALRIAAERIGRNNYRSGIYRPGNRYVRGGYTITDAHKAIIDAMPQVLDGRITPEQAMALLHTYDAMKERLGK